MKFMIRIFVLIFCVLSFVNVANAASAREQLKQMVQQLQKTPADEALREQIIKLAQKIKPAPAIPEEARRYLARGIAAIETAKNEQDSGQAVSEFQKAANAAPWWPDAYLNLAKVQEKIRDYKGAISSYGVYLIANPNAKDAESIRTQSYKLEYMAEQKAKEDEMKAKEEQRKEQAQYVLNLFKQRVEGATYNRRFCETGVIGGDDGLLYSDSSKAFAAGNSSAHGNGCNREEYTGRNWINGGDGAVERFDFSEEGKIRLVFISSVLRTENINLIGIPNGSSISDIKWECPVIEWEGSNARISGTKPAWVSLHEDGSAITFTCDTPYPESNPTVKYQYTYFKRN